MGMSTSGGCLDYRGEMFVHPVWLLKRRRRPRFDRVDLCTSQQISPSTQPASAQPHVETPRSAVHDQKGNQQTGSHSGGGRKRPVGRNLGAHPDSGGRSEDPKTGERRTCHQKHGCLNKWTSFTVMEMLINQRFDGEDGTTGKGPRGDHTNCSYMPLRQDHDLAHTHTQPLRCGN